ncbi:MAG TPA: Ig-like domain-containing protein [Chitinophagaceae bacterium]|nr:Ig-like domain-containing protein [Chitinophagaceae bacterium]
MSRRYKDLLIFISICLVSLAVYSCANIVPPSGGPEDKTPPELIAISPADSQLETRVTKILLEFDKNMEVGDLSEHFSISPLLSNPPEILANRKKVTVTIPDSLLEKETTYFLDFGKALTDNREKTPAQNLTYLFSTGNYFDSLSIKGRVLAAETGTADSKATVILHPTPMEDSSIITHFPKYAVHTDEQGYFEFQMLPKGPYAIFALREDGPNFKWDGYSEGIGFTSENLEAYNPQSLDKLQLIYTSNPFEADTSKVEDSGNESSGLRKRSTTSKTPIAPYQVKVDTLLKEGQDLTKGLKILIADSNIVIDQEKILLTYDMDGTEIESIIKAEREELNLILNTEWKEDTNYTLRLVNGWAKNEKDDVLNPGKYTFKTKAKKEYATIRLKPENELVAQNYRVIVVQEKDTIIHEPIDKDIMEYEWMQPQTIAIFIYKDLNQNGKWDAGDYWTKTQPELMMPVLKDGAIRGGWENEFTLALPADPLEELKNHFERKQHTGSLRGKSDAKDKKEEKDSEED